MAPRIAAQPPRSTANLPTLSIPSPASPDAAEDAFAQFLERLENGEPADFEALCREHAALAPALRRIHRRWQAMTRAFGELSRSGGSTPPVTAASPSVDALMQKLGASGVRIERYAIGAEIARGGMGRVVQAWDEELRREVALKIHRGDPADTRQRRRFLEEAQIAAQLDHPGIVPVHELGLDADGRPFFSMQLVRGLDLGRILDLAQRGDDGWSRTRVLHVLLRACEAVAFAHAKGVVHRDLKPANIMVGPFHETYVMDWGLARVRAAQAADGDEVDTLRTAIAGEDGGSPLLTGSGDVLGTPAYMAPEQAANGAADTTADVYAIGAILYHLLAGHMPYAEQGTPDADTLLRRLAVGPPPRLGDDVPAELRAICEHAMARAPERRYPDIGALATDLRAFLELRTVRAYATGRFAELRKWVARNRALTASFAALLLALLVGATVATALWVRAERNRERADDTAARLLSELDRSAFRSARLALQVDNSSDAAGSLWRAHLEGRMPRATSWALHELAERDPYLTTVPLHEPMLPIAFAATVDAVLVGTPDGRLQVRDPLTLALREEFGPAPSAITCLAVLAGGPWAIAGDRDGGITVFDLANRTRAPSRPAHRGAVRELLATGGLAFVSGGEDGRVLHWPRPDAEPEPLLQFDTAVGSLALRPGGDGIAAGDQGGEVRGCTFDGTAVWQRRAGTRQVMALAFGRDADELWAGSTDHTIRRLRLDAAGGDRTLPTRNGSCRQLVRDVDGSLLAAGWWRIDRLAVDGDRPHALALRGASHITLQPERRLLVTAGATSGLGLLDLGTRDRRRLAGQGVALSDDGRRVVTLVDGFAVVRTVDDDRVVATLPAGDAACVHLSPDGDRLAIATRPPVRVRMVEVDGGRELFAVDGPGDVSFHEACSFSPDGRELAVRVGTQRIERRDSGSGEVIGSYERADARWFRTRYSGDGHWLAAIGRGSSTVWRLDLRTQTTSEVDFAVERPGGLAGSLSAVALSHDGGRIAVGTWQGQVAVRHHDGATREIAAHAGTIWSLEFAADDDGMLFSAGGSQGVAGWDLDTYECCYQAVRDMVTRMHLSRDLQTLACQTPDGPLLLDLAYRQRHVAGNLDFQLGHQRSHVAVDPQRERALRRWAADVLARPWPRWR
jgi:WD40 repeat protein/tRNA A-37 threonylcarbamoyl transferase component Bud32